MKMAAGAATTRNRPARNGESHEMARRSGDSF